jgi:hypothetical protein
MVDVLTKGIVNSQFEMCKEELGLNFSLNENVRNLKHTNNTEKYMKMKIKLIN